MSMMGHEGVHLTTYTDGTAKVTFTLNDRPTDSATVIELTETGYRNLVREVLVQLMPTGEKR